MNLLQRISLFFIYTIFLLSPLDSAHAASPEESVCSGGDAQLTARTWTELYRHWIRYARCDDGGLGELYSEKVVYLLTAKWDRVPELAGLAAKHPKFGRFVLRHVDELMSPDEANTIQKNAKSHCPDNATSLCRQIVDQLAKDPA